LSSKREREGKSFQHVWHFGDLIWHTSLLVWQHAKEITFLYVFTTRMQSDLPSLFTGTLLIVTVLFPPMYRTLAVQECFEEPSLSGALKVFTA
jgi:hypothetical protein